MGTRANVYTNLKVRANTVVTNTKVEKCTPKAVDESPVSVGQITTWLGTLSPNTRINTDNNGVLRRYLSDLLQSNVKSVSVNKDGVSAKVNKRTVQYQNAEGLVTLLRKVRGGAGNTGLVSPKRALEVLKGN